MPNYEIRTGLNYPSDQVPDGERRAEPGDVVDDLPATSVAWLVREGLAVATDRDVTPIARRRTRQTTPLPETPDAGNADESDAAAPEG